MNTSQKNSIEIILNGHLDEIANLASALDRFFNDAIMSDLVKNQITVMGRSSSIYWCLIIS
jgi:hypothetical protein